MQTNRDAFKAFKSASDQTAKAGYFIDSAGVIVAVATAKPFGLIIDGGDEDQTTTAAICAGGHAGKFSVKLSASPGTVNAGTRLVLSSATLGTVKADDGTAGNVQVAEALETGAANELIEAVLIRPVIVGPDSIDDDSITADKIAANAVTTAKIIDDAVTTDKIIDDAVTTAKILDENVTTGKIADNAVTGAKLADAVSDQIRSTTVAVANTPVTPDGVAHITGQVKDSEGNALTGRHLIQLFFSATSYGDSTDLGTLTALTNSKLLKEITDDAIAHIITHTDGSWGAELDLAADGDVYAHAVVLGLHVVANAAITGN